MVATLQFLLRGGSRPGPSAFHGPVTARSRPRQLDLRPQLVAAQESDPRWRSWFQRVLDRKSAGCLIRYGSSDCAFTGYTDRDPNAMPRT